ncbi:response regulator transcription factor [Marinomonas agarivorans]|nr:response regulator transcription factor [Marinomonas agarivorans]
MYSLLIADDHPLFRDALKNAIFNHLNDLNIHETNSLESTLQYLSAEPELDLLLLDLNMPGSGDLYGLMKIRFQFPELPIAVVSGSDEPEIVANVIHAGALGFIPKTSQSSEIANAILTIMAGEVWLPDHMRDVVNQSPDATQQAAQKVAELTPAQYNILCYLNEGLLNKQIAYELNISEATVKAHITAIFRKLNINNRTQAVLIASSLKLKTLAL